MTVCERMALVLKGLVKGLGITTDILMRELNIGKQRATGILEGRRNSLRSSDYFAICELTGLKCNLLQKAMKEAD